MGMKGFLPFTLILAGIIITAVIFITVIIVDIFFEYHIKIILKYEYERNFGDLTMLELFRYQKGQLSGYEILSKNKPTELSDEQKQFLNETLALLTQAGKYKLTDGHDVIVEAAIKETKGSTYTHEAFIFRPYNPDRLVGRLYLTYEK